MPCRSCSQNAEVLLKQKQNEDWLSQEEVKEICVPCYENMVKNKILKVKKAYLVSKLESRTMMFYEVTFKGSANSKFNFGGHTLDPFMPKYFEEQEMPISYKEAKSLPNLDVNIVELPEKPTVEQVQLKKLAGKGLMWVGASPKRVNEFGVFVKNVPNYTVSEEGFKALGSNTSFKVV